MQTIYELLQEEKKTLLDVRTTSEFFGNHVEGAVNIPLQELRERIEEVEKMDKPIVVYCLSGGRSTTAVNFLKQQGIEDVYNGGGIGTMQLMMM